MILINISNHPSDKWAKEQREGWDKIIDVPFPNIDPKLGTNGVKDIVMNVIKEVKQIGNPANIMLQGEFSFCFLFKEEAEKEINPVVWWIPTTERTVIEKQKEDGSVEKTTIFKFCRWRCI